jgi:hypothetical protein
VLGGAAAGALLLTGELAVIVWNRYPTRDLLTPLPWVWLIGFLLGGGLAVASWVGVRVWRGRATTEPGRRAAIITSAVSFVILTALIVVQVNDRYLPGLLHPLSLVSTTLLVAGLGVLAWWVTKQAPRLLGQRSLRGMILFSFLILVLGLSLQGTLPAEEQELALWRPNGERAEPAATSGSSTDHGKRELLVIGIDGAGWGVIEPLWQQGKLPHLASLAQRGCRGILVSDEDAMSPVVWTTLFTGREPARHGVDGWHRALSSNRRVKALWNILDDFDRHTFVVNVPGSFPAETVRGGVVAGFPLPRGSRSSLGFRLMTKPRASTDGPIAIELPSNLGEETIEVVLRDLASRFAFEETALYQALHRLDRGLAQRTAHALAARAYATLELRRRGSSSERRLVVTAAGTGTVLADLAVGEWSPWLVAGVAGEESLLRARLLALDERSLDLYITPLFPLAGVGRAQPPALATSTDAGFPFIAEGIGWQLFRDPTLLAALEEHLLDVGAGRARLSQRLLRQAPWDVLVHVFTETDRLQHAFWKFREPEYYRQHGESSLTTTDDFERFATTIDRAYEQVDSLLGDMLAEIGAETTVLVVSDHAAQAGEHPLAPTAGIHHRDGIYLVAGPRVAPTACGAPELGAPLRLVDILPLIMSQLGLPLAHDLDGSVPQALLPHRDGAHAPLPPSLASYESALEAPAADAEIDETLREQLRSLGYVQ